MTAHTSGGSGTRRTRRVVPLVARALAAEGRFEVTADSLELVESFRPGIS